VSPLQLLGLVGVFAAARGVLTLRPVATGPSSQATAQVREYLDALIVAGLIALFLITFVVRTFYIPSESMVPTLEQRDVLLVNEFAYRFRTPHRSDVVVFRPPIPSSSDFIKRVIAVPGDTLRIAGGTIYVNGRPIAEPPGATTPDYNLRIENYGIAIDSGDGYQPLDPQMADIPPRRMWKAPDRVPDGFYFVMGDNRNDSDDSHIWGFAQLRGTFAAGPLQGKAAAGFVGRAFLVLWPMQRIRILD
jgi:signal peptidase I